MIFDALRASARFWGRWNDPQAPGELSLGQLFAILLCTTVVRAFADMLWIGTRIPHFFLNIFVWFFFLWGISFGLAWVLAQLARLAGAAISVESERTLVAAAVHLFWVVVLVPLVSLLPYEKRWGLGIFVTVPFFKYIPTFAVEKNYVPLGMLTVIPFLLARTSWLIRAHFKLSWLRAIAVATVGFFIVYVVYYQWIYTHGAVTGFFRAGGMSGGYLSIAVMFLTDTFGHQVALTLLLPWIFRVYQRSLAYAVLVLVPLVACAFWPKAGVVPFWFLGQ